VDESLVECKRMFLLALDVTASDCSNLCICGSATQKRSFVDLSRTLLDVDALSYKYNT